ncbi:hypothetical protein CEXT_178321 [Caerostris extrusa]|uniref:Uncharacterized protein n=1 Tax=Caerostris extrusa TaxID=172846 RepID=A0AAV4QLA2_CAEEX|nr:hypothetical protein CEXT_178321 [Caerostris extrusa]
MHQVSEQARRDRCLALLVEIICCACEEWPSSNDETCSIGGILSLEGVFPASLTLYDTTQINNKLFQHVVCVVHHAYVEEDGLDIKVCF